MSFLEHTTVPELVSELTPHIIPEEQFVATFPQSPVDGAVYFTPRTVSRSSNEWNSMPVIDQLAQLDRRIDLIKGIGAATTIHIDSLCANNETLEAENKQLTQESLTDALTGLRNRRAFTAALEELVISHKGDNDPRIALLFIDLDNFKKVNDNEGHDVGDKLLKEIAKDLEKSLKLREEDKIYRLGGDEFVIIANTKKLHNSRREEKTELVATLGLVKRIVRVVENSSIKIKVPYVSASVGAVTYIPGETSVAFLKRADEAMYIDKQNRKAARQ